MRGGRVLAEQVAQETCPGVGDALGRRDGCQVRQGGTWLVAHDRGEITVRRLSDDPSRVFSETAAFPEPCPGERGYATPAPDGLVVAGSDRVTSLAADGSVRWTFRHAAWPVDGLGRGACVVTASGAVVLVTVTGRLMADGYEGDLCVALDGASGEPLGERVLPTCSAAYGFQQALVPSDVVFLSAGQGQDDAHSLLVSYAGDGIRALPAGPADEPFTGNSPDGVGFLKLTRRGEILTRYEATASGLCRAGADVAAATALEDPELCFAGSPGFLDRHRVLAAVAYDIWPEESRHLLLDATSLEPLAEIAYPFAVSPEPVPLGDGTWITVRDDDVLRWRVR